MAEQTAVDLERALGLCTFCPSLCRHTCPVATAEGSDTTSPWGMMSLARHLRSGAVSPDPDALATIGACNGCGACTEFCLHSVPVLESLVQVRAELVDARSAEALHAVSVRPGRLPEAERLADLGARSRYERRPTISLLPGRGAVPEAVQTLLSLCDQLDVEALACGELAQLELGYDAWFSGDHRTFKTIAEHVHSAAAEAADIVVMSAEALFLLKEIYPRFGYAFGADILHVSEMLLPILSGAVVRRLPGAVGYHESCHLKRHLDISDVPRQVLRRILDGPLRELPQRADITGCCGGTGRRGARESTTERMADDILLAAAQAGIERLVSFSGECVEALRGAFARASERGITELPSVDHAVSLVAEAVIGDGAAA